MDTIRLLDEETNAIWFGELHSEVDGHTIFIKDCWSEIKQRKILTSLSKRRVTPVYLEEIGEISFEPLHIDRRRELQRTSTLVIDIVDCVVNSGFEAIFLTNDVSCIRVILNVTFHAHSCVEGVLDRV